MIHKRDKREKNAGRKKRGNTLLICIEMDHDSLDPRCDLIRGAIF